MLIVFIVTGRLISKDKKNYWKYAKWPVITFTLILGLRLNRGHDIFIIWKYIFMI